MEITEIYTSGDIGFNDDQPYLLKLDRAIVKDVFTQADVEEGVVEVKDNKLYVGGNILLTGDIIVKYNHD